jgi:hypothetical protein
MMGSKYKHAHAPTLVSMLSYMGPAIELVEHGEICTSTGLYQRLLTILLCGLHGCTSQQILRLFALKCSRLIYL